MCWMDFLSLPVELSRLFTLADSPAALLFGRRDLCLDLCPNVGAGGRGRPRLCCICATHGGSFPRTDPLPHEGWAVGFSHITAVHKQINDRDIAPIVIDFKFSTSKPVEQARTHIPVALQRQA